MKTTEQPDVADPRPDVATLPGRDHRLMLLYCQSVEANHGGDVRHAATLGCMAGSSRVRDRRAGGTVASDGTRWGGGGWRPECGTRYDDGSTAPDHDDYDCVADLEAWGFLRDLGTGFQPVVVLTPKGHALCAALTAARGAARRPMSRRSG